MQGHGNALTTVEVCRVVWARSDGNPWWPAYVCDPSKLRDELYALGSSHRRMLRKAKAEPNEFFLVFYFGAHHFRLHAPNDGTLQPWMCPRYYEFLHGHSQFKRGPLKDAFREAIREAKDFVAANEETRLLPRMVPSDMDLSLEPPPSSLSQTKMQPVQDAIVVIGSGPFEDPSSPDLDLDLDNDTTTLTSPGHVLTADDLPFHCLAWSYVVGKTWWPVYVCDPDVIGTHAKAADKRSKLRKLEATYATEIRIAQANAGTQRLLYFFGRHIIRLHDTAASVSNTGIKPWECTEHAKYLAGDVGLARKDEEYARAMKEVKDYVMLAPEINPNPPYVPSKASTPSPADSPPQEAPPPPPLPLPSQLTTESTPPTLQSSDPRCSHPPNTNTNPSANSSPSSSGVSSEPPKVVDHKAPVSLNGLGAAVAVASIPQGDNVSPTCGEDGGSSVKTEAQADAASPVREGVAWAFLNDQLWWPVLVCGFKLDDNTPGMPPSEPPRNQVVDVYYFGRKHFGNIDSTVLKPWNGPEHTSFIYDQSMLETKSKAFVSAFADAVAEAGDFASVLHTLSDQPANSPPTAPLIPSAEPPRKKQALLTLPTRSNQLISEYVMLRNVVQAVVPAWKVASATMTLENLAEFTKSLQIVLNQLHAIMRKIIDNPRTIVTPLVFVSTYHSAVMCVWTMVLSVSLKNAAPASRSDTHFMHTCLHCFLESVDGVYKPLLHSSVVHRCLQFAHIATQYARAPLAPEVQRARAWMHDFFQLYLAKPPTYDKCRALVADTTSGLGRLPVPVTRELAKLTALRHGFEHPAVDVEPAADNQQEASMSFHGQSLGLHIGETQNGLRVLGMTPTAPEPTKRAVQSGTIQRGDVIVAVNSIPIAQFGGFRELCAVVASTARPIVLTFRRRPVRPVTVEPQDAARPRNAPPQDDPTLADTQTESAAHHPAPPPPPSNSFLDTRRRMPPLPTGLQRQPSIIHTLDELNPGASTHEVANVATNSARRYVDPPAIAAEYGGHATSQLGPQQDSRFVEMATQGCHDPRVRRSDTNHFPEPCNVASLEQGFQTTTPLPPSNVNTSTTWNIPPQPSLRPFNTMQFAPPPATMFDQAAPPLDMSYYNPPTNPPGGYFGAPPTYMNYHQPNVVYVAVPAGHPLYHSVLQQSMAASYPPPPSFPPQFQQHSHAWNPNEYAPP